MALSRGPYGDPTCYRGTIVKTSIDGVSVGLVLRLTALPALFGESSRRSPASMDHRTNLAILYKIV